ncbi:MAG: hypothetical protein JWN34_1847 [Bryobacterales bacterium]|nr:hypothetical protein [Bryobacterales bacterium]
MHYSGDDMMNMHFATTLNPWRLGKAVIMFWIPVYRPLGGSVYRVLYEFLGFNPFPLNLISWLILAGNVVLAYRLFKAITGVTTASFVALAFTLVHPTFSDLYISAGTIYDHLWFLFTVLGMTCYVRWRGSDRGLTPARQALLVLLCILSMASKESGVALPVLLGLYELIFCYPGHRAVMPWLRARGPLFLLLAIIVLIDIRRVNHTPEIAMTAAYHAKPSLSLWLERMGQYFGILSGNHLSFSRLPAGVVLLVMAAAGYALRSRTMLFGLGYFLVTLTPVALISLRPGYVLYVPEVGLGLWLAGAFIASTAALPRIRPATAALATGLALWFFVANWPAPFDPNIIPEKRLSEQFQREFPKMSKGARLLFITDDFPQSGWDLAFNLQLLYNDQTLTVHRLQAPADQGPSDRNKLEDYNHVFTLSGGKYQELDRRNIAESMRLNILADYTVGREIDMGRKDHGAYVVSGLMDGDNPDPSRWTEPKSRYKFDVHPELTDFHAKFWVPDFVTRTGQSRLVILVNGHEIGTLPLTKDGSNEIRFPVPASAISPGGTYTYVDLNVEKPWKDPNGMAFGVILMNAGFDYVRATIK